jgi:hypothetical protein
MGWMTEVRFQQEQGRDFVFATASIPPLKPINPSIEWVLGSVSGLKVAGT